MDSIEFHRLIDENKNKFCCVNLKDGSVYEGVNRGSHGCNIQQGIISMFLENKGGNHYFGHTEVQSIDFNE